MNSLTNQSDSLRMKCSNHNQLGPGSLFLIAMRLIVKISPSTMHLSSSQLGCNDEQMNFLYSRPSMPAPLTKTCALY